ncbi:MAG TPA: pyridoxal phosphate-dependent aminotransferase [Thermoanaerobaculia bacterium]|nr:pyridoxal phosphate-dependent aminotransferase [Thermoanaerobaculia bacterium]
MTPFSRRSEWQASVNRLTAARAERVRRGDEILDLTLSNPTAAGLEYPLDELSDALGRAAREPYDPQPLGIRSAREAVAEHLRCDPADVVITASTSEAYSFLFKLLTDPGDEIAAAVPSYPLLEHLAALELVSLRTFPLELHGRWELHEVHPAARTRAITIVSPNNPTGSFVRDEEMRRLAAHGLPLIVDEVFGEYALDGTVAATPPEEVLSFRLDGLSKSAGLPHYKLGWIRAAGPAPARRAALAALELIADNFLSVSTPVQAALPELLRIGASIRAKIRERIVSNLRLLREAVKEQPAVTLLPVEGGWSAVLRVPAVTTDEEMALALLDRGVVVQPGYFFDFPGEGFLVISLLTPRETFSEGLRRISFVVP